MDGCIHYNPNLGKGKKMLRKHNEKATALTETILKEVNNFAEKACVNAGLLL